VRSYLYQVPSSRAQNVATEPLTNLTSANHGLPLKALLH
jgi:hypothetical protein